MRVMISGQMRSGTTFLANILSSQTGVLVLADFLHIDRLKGELGVPSLRTVLTDEHKTRLWDRFVGVPGGDGCEAIAAATGRTFKLDIKFNEFQTLLDFYLLVLERVRPEGYGVIGHKSTCAEPIFQELLDEVPDVKLLYCVRDPRDVVLSNMKMMGQAAETILRNWQTGRNEALRIAENPAYRGRILLVSYENLMQRPKRSMQEITDFLGLPKFVMPDQAKWYGVNYVANSSFDDIKKLFDTKGIGRWRSEGDWINTLAAEMLGSDLRAAGYSLPFRVTARRALASVRQAFTFGRRAA